MEIIDRFASSLQGLASIVPSDIGGPVLLILLGSVVALFLMGFTLGRSRMAIFTLATYAAAFFELQAQTLYQSALSGSTLLWVRISVFVIFLVLAFFACSTSFLKKSLSTKNHSPIFIGLSSLAAAGLLLSVLLSFVADNPAVTGVPPYLLALFATKGSRLIWAAIPLGVIFLFKAKSPRDKFDKNIL